MEWGTFAFSVTSNILCQSPKILQWKFGILKSQEKKLIVLELSESTLGQFSQQLREKGICLLEEWKESSDVGTFPERSMWVSRKSSWLVVGAIVRIKNCSQFGRCSIIHRRYLNNYEASDVFYFFWSSYPSFSNWVRLKFSDFEI